MDKLYFNIIREDKSIPRGKIIHIDENKGDIEETHKTVSDNYPKYQNANGKFT